MTFELTCYPLDGAVPLEPARHDRGVFDANRHAYRCLPLTIANTAGWELLAPCGVTVEWNGGPAIADLVVTLDEPSDRPFAKSHFATGIVTFDLGWIFRTSPGDHLWAMGPPNDPKDGIAPLSGLIETDWLPYTFTMNWKMTRPGVVRFEKGEPICFISPARIGAVADCQPVLRQLAEDPALRADLDAWTADRGAFMERLAAGEADALKTPWGKRYFAGEEAPRHFRKLRARPVQASEPEPERDRLDGAGRLTLSPSTRIVRCAADARGLDILVVDNFVPSSLCDRLVAIHAGAAASYELTEEGFWRDRLLGYRDVEAISQGAAAEVRALIHASIRLVMAKQRSPSPLYADVMHLVGWPVGWHMPPHADNAHRDGSPHAMAHRAYSGVCYLTDDFDGGGVYLPAQDVLIQPRRGMFVSLPAGLTHEHAVTRVERGLRTTLAFFLTYDKQRADRALYRLDVAA